jgi:hypothetical protein
MKKSSAWFLFAIFYSSMLTSEVRAQLPPVAVSLKQVVDTRSSDVNESRLSITLKIEGELVAQAFEYGTVELQEPSNVVVKIGLTDEKGYAPLKRGGFGDKLSEALLSFELASPLRNQSAFPLLVGAFKLKTYRQQLIPVGNVLARRNETLRDPLFEAHGMKVRIVDPRQAFPGLTDEAEVAKLLTSSVAIEFTGETKKVRSFILETLEGKPIRTFAGSFGAGRTLILSQRASEPLPVDVVAKILIPVAPEEISVPFKLENVVLP